MDGNWIKLNRQLLTSNVFEDAKTLQVFLWLLLNANYKKRTLLNGLTLHPGQLCTSRSRIATGCNMHESSVSRVLKRLQRCSSIVQKSNSRGTVIDIVNWGLFQHAEGTAEQQTNSQRTASEQLANIEEEGKKEKKERKDNISAQTDGLHTLNGSQKVTQFSEEFIRFWDLWPSGGRKTNKQRAFAAFKRAKAQVELSVLMEAVAAFAASPKGRGTFCPMPSSWLAGGCWDDDRASWQDGQQPVYKKREKPIEVQRVEQLESQFLAARNKLVAMEKDTDEYNRQELETVKILAAVQQAREEQQ